MITKLFRYALGSLLAGGFLAGCGSAPTQPVVSDLQFPVLVIYLNAGHERFDDAASLGDMSMQSVLMYKEPPFLIDSAMRIFQLADLKSTKSGLAIMASGGAGRTPVSFTLTATSDAGVVAARGLVQKHCNAFRDGPDADRRREELAKAETIPQIIAAIEGQR